MSPTLKIAALSLQNCMLKMFLTNYQNRLPPSLPLNINSTSQYSRFSAWNPMLLKYFQKLLIQTFAFRFRKTRRSLTWFYILLVSSCRILPLVLKPSIFSWKRNCQSYSLIHNSHWLKRHDKIEQKRDLTMFSLHKKMPVTLFLLPS